MDSIFPVIIAIFFVAIFAALLTLLAGRKASGKKKTDNRKNATRLVRDATRKLKQDPHNASALSELSDFYFCEHNWEKAYPLYNTLFDIVKIHPEINEFQVSLRQGICAIKLNKIPDAFRGLSSAYQLRPDEYDVCYNLGLACYLNNDYEKAIPCLRKALAINPEASEVYGPLGTSLYKGGKFMDSLKFLRKSLDEHPDRKDLLFNLADAMYQSGLGDKAMKVFMHLRPDPEFGPQSCLIAGKIHINNKMYEKALQDFEIGVKLQNVSRETTVELRYQLASAYFAMNNMGKGLENLKQIQAMLPNYKDVPVLISRYQELNQNANLRIYLNSGTSDFVALCRKIVVAYFPTSFVKVLDISVNQESSEILCNVEANKWEDTELFRFYRTTGSTGELYIRDFHVRVRDTKSDRGVCFTAGAFSEEAHHYTEGRPIDLLEKDQLIKLLKKVDTVN
jgi:tetratricopeptide (TPR) repeat protein